MTKKKDKPWAQDELDKVLNILLSDPTIGTHNFEMMCERVGLRFGRTADSITTILWKLATRYKEHANYSPGILRMQRRHQPFNWVDEYFCRTAWNKKDITVQVHIAGVLMRPLAQIVDWYEQRESKGRKKLGVFK